MSVVDAERTAASSGLRASLERLRARQQRFAIHPSVPPTEDWTYCAQALADPAYFDRWRKRLAGWLTEQYGEAPEQTTAGYVLNWYARIPAELGALLFHHERRVPSLHPDQLAFRLASGRPHPEAVALTGREFACLPDDPAAGTPEVTVVADERALAALLRARYTAHLAHFMVAFGTGVRFGRRTLWAAATDALDTALWQAGLASGHEGEAVADAMLVLPTRLEPFTAGSTLRPVTDADGHQQWSRRREGCCFHYLLKHGQGDCATCPRVLPKD